MNVRSLTVGFVLGMLAVAGVGAAFSQDKGGGQAPAQPSPDEMQKMMKEWAASIEVREEHNALAKWAGTYDTTTRVWIMGPDQPPQEFKGASEMKAVLGGRFLQQNDHSQMLLPNPETGAPELKPMEGMGFLGYDNYQRMYVGCWASSSSTQLLTMRGGMSPDGKKLTLYAEMDEPMLGVRGRLIKCVTQFIGDDTQDFSVYDLHAGDDYKAFEIEYKRRK